jgi:sulfopyruvate decarboxylase TPP-binding subunit
VVTKIVKPAFEGHPAKVEISPTRELVRPGICARAFLAGKSTYYNGFNLTSGVRFGFYAAENHDLR